MPHMTARAVLGIAVSAALAACGSSSSTSAVGGGIPGGVGGLATPGGGTPAGGGSRTPSLVPGKPTINATVSLTGTITYSGSYSTQLDKYASCGDYAKGKDFPIPSKNTTDRIFEVPGANSNNDQHPVVQGDIFGYSGPGTFSDMTKIVPPDAGSERLSVTPYDPAGEQGSDTTAYADPTYGSKVTLTVNGDGSGSLTFESLQDSGSQKTSGSLTWTCSG